MTHPMLRGPVPAQPSAPQRTAVPAVAVSQFFLGIDLGQLTDHTASAVVRRTLVTEPWRTPDGEVVQVASRTPSGRLIRQFDVLALRRYDLGTPYTAIVRHVKEQVPKLPRAKLILDATGVGRAITDMFRDLLVDTVAISITGGNSWSHVGAGEYHVSKTELVAAIRVALETERLKVARGVAHGDTLRRELVEFKIKISKSANELYSAREGEHDDIVLAIALPIWYSWFLDRANAWIAGADKVDVGSLRNPLRITADASRLYGIRSRRQPNMEE